jgi:hypothetical protein
MKTVVLITLGAVLWLTEVYGQGVFEFNNAYARTRLYTIDGPLAGPGIWAHMYVGETPNDLIPVGASAEHIFPPVGAVRGGDIVVDWIPYGGDAFVQMVAWDGGLWGTDLANVPPTQLGATDIVPITLAGTPGGPIPIPRFTVPAVVPPIPEPSAASICLMGSALAFAVYVHCSSQVRRKCKCKCVVRVAVP